MLEVKATLKNHLINWAVSNQYEYFFTKSKSMYVIIDYIIYMVYDYKIHDKKLIVKIMRFSN